MRKTIVLFVFLLICLLTGQAQQRGDSFFEFSAGGGWSTITYSLQGTPITLDAKQMGSYGLSFHVGYGFFLHPNVGVGIGADVSRYGANARMNGEVTWIGVADTDGEKYNHYANVNMWHDTQELYYVEVPLALYFFIPTNSALNLSAQVGVKYAYPFLQKTAFEGNVTHVGYYPQWALTLTDIPNHGFYTEELSGRGQVGIEHQMIAFAKLGVTVPIGQKVSFFSNLYASCGIRNIMGSVEDNQELGFRTNTEEAAQVHPFIPIAVSLWETNVPSGKFLPVSVGLELGVRIHLTSNTRKFPCRCLMDN